MKAIRYALILCCAGASALTQAQERTMPEEYRTLITVYKVGRIPLEDLRGVCRWNTPAAGVREDLAAAQRQNIQFCEGFLSGALEFTRLDGEVLRRFAGGDLGLDLQKCGATSVAALRTRVQRGTELDMRQLASEAVLGKLLGCMR